ncbi:FAD-dependent oxidoreductase [Streptomyces sp. MST-110588]|uniref:NAD(P)/FAD-dependent oxidoreductase n=1 Tax=Streptomyces sp. MST-110588 TaxID=2833628 RepID=UPI001F5C6193|nr:FAD-dependent oxidoreductase [Streptomyces sp. MST-110588]UNO41644.1 FAD-binding oxidoreductase [Streptomyces sp. MST-110588]
MRVTRVQTGQPVVGHPDVIVVGSGIIGAACAESLTRRGIRVTVLDRGPLASGTTASGEGNLLVSDKPPGPELALTQASLERWPRLLAELGGGGAYGDARDGAYGAAFDGAHGGAYGGARGGAYGCEYEAKGGLVVALEDAGAQRLRAFAAAQRGAGVQVHDISPDEVSTYEPHLTPGVRAAAYYPQDAQLQPVLAATTLLAAVRARGAEVRTGVTALGVEQAADGRVTAVRTCAGPLPCGAVVNACGPWAGRFAEAAGAPLPVLPRRGMVLVTTALPPGTVRHKVYDAGYVGAVGSGEADLRTSAVVESTHGGTVLIGSSRQRVGFDATVRVAVLRELARNAMALFPALGRVPVIRAYGGFRPYTPDHLPVIGEDPRRPGLWHATGHEGAGIGLAAATGELLAGLYAGEPPLVDPAPFRVDRPGLGLGADPERIRTSGSGSGPGSDSGSGPGSGAGPGPGSGSGAEGSEGLSCSV